MGTTTRRDITLLALLALGLCVPFLNKAYHIDDPLVVWTAQQIVAHPADFYGYSANWYGFTQTMAEIDQNPPGAAYYAAPFGLLFGWGEIAMHAPVALLLAALACGVYLLARQMGALPRVAALAAMFSPGVLVSASTVMTDLPMATCFVWGATLWARGLESKSPAPNIASAMVITAGVLTKFFAISLVPLLLVFTAMSGRRAWPRATLLLMPLLALAVYELYTRHLYGFGHFLASAGYAAAYQENQGLDAARKILTGFAFLGAGAAPALFLAPVLWRDAGRGGVAMLMALAAAGVAALWWRGWQPAETGKPLPALFWLQYALWMAAGIHILLLATAEIYTRRDRWSVLLLLWLVGTLVFGMFLYHFVNIRVLLPALPAVALLCARRLAHLDDPPPRFGLSIALAAALALALAVASADLRLANAQRIAAQRIAPETRPGTTWFSGHWGFQYYMEVRGARPIDRNNPMLRDGDTVVTPANASNRITVKPDGASLPESMELPVCQWLTTMHQDVGAGFYSEIWGPLPFVFGVVPKEKYEILPLGR